ncbi:TetR/AcrR family transcriptional regulator [Promicromonospora sp. NPDC059942]|uniref:TetR/AcrR family transcriptional regulator n=1 Tax=Promicromonospora sp. NPDC059942 TaxID=3347009 RepID=UPI00365EE0A7
MSSSTRRARERNALRERITEAAFRVLETEGATALTIRRIAAEVEYTAPVVYQHFANKDALVLELVTRGYDLMVVEFEQVAGEPDLDQRVLRTGSAFVRFACEHPHLYQAMNGTVIDANDRRRAAEPAIEMVTELLSAWAETHGVVLVDRTEACEIVWGTLAGMSSLGDLGTVGSERAQRLAEQALGAILLGWRSKGSSG